ncbi:PEGA domain-containing protein [Sorangium sp. So ce1151]|uniref:PEGA domain-containing protein n=1 Tax=Sorangium sp. So ce1151 TaxID=3133332 RepID=UPI003F5E6837
MIGRKPLTHHRMRTIAAIIVTSLLFEGSLLAQSGDDKKEAQVHIKRAYDLAKYKKNYSDAITEYHRAQKADPNSLDAAIGLFFCHYNLGHLVEAYNEASAAQQLAEGRDIELAKVANERMQEVARKLGTINIVSERAGATISVDGLYRGMHPSASPLRVLPGAHFVRMYKDGFQLFEAKIDVAAGQSIQVEAVMPALVAAGRLQVTELSGAAVDVFIDGNLVGRTPWEGSLAIFDERDALIEHSVVLRGKGNLGTTPVSVTLDARQTTPLPLVVEELAGTLRVVPAPVNAHVMVDGTPVGRGIWEGRLRAGRDKHTVVVSADGYLVRQKSVALERDKITTVEIALQRDEAAKKWRPSSLATLELAGAGTLGPGFGGSCAERCGESVAGGVLGMLHLGYEPWWGRGFSFGLSAGYLRHTSSRKAAILPVGRTASIAASDGLLLQGGAVGLWAGYSFGERYPLRFRLGAGLVRGPLHDRRAVEASYPAYVGPAATLGYVDPQLLFRVYKRGGFELNLRAEALIFFTHSEPTWAQDHPVYTREAGYVHFPAESLLGSALFVFAPGLSARYAYAF